MPAGLGVAAYLSKRSRAKIRAARAAMEAERALEEVRILAEVASTFNTEGNLVQAFRRVLPLVVALLGSEAAVARLGEEVLTAGLPPSSPEVRAVLGVGGDPGVARAEERLTLAAGPGWRALGARIGRSPLDVLYVLRQGEPFNERERSLLTSVAADARAAAARWALEEALTAAAEERLALLRRLVRLQEEERARVARDLHDDLGQALTAAYIEATRGEDTGRILKGLEEALRGLQRAVWSLSPPLLEELGLAAALRKYVENNPSAELKVELEVEGPIPSLPREVSLACFRIVQEALANVARHARATRAKVKLAATSRNLLVEVADNGRGMPGSARGAWWRGGEFPAGAGLGLLFMKERAESLGGRLEVYSSPQGTRVMATLPLPPAALPPKEQRHYPGEGMDSPKESV